MLNNKINSMIKTVLSFAFAFAVTLVSAQCENNYDFGDVGFGVSPDPELGESFEVGTVGMAYSDTINMLVPSDAADVDPQYEGLGVVIDSLTLASVEVQIDGDFVNLADIGLDIVCNNNGDSPDPCTFMGALQYCALVEGVPTTAGTFPLTINVDGYIVVFGNTVPVPIAFDQYSLTILEEGGSSIGINEQNDLEVLQNSPNPFYGKTKMHFSLGQPDEVSFTVMNLLGEEVYHELVDGQRGENTLIYETLSLRSGIYLYSFEVKGKKITKRMVIN